MFVLNDTICRHCRSFVLDILQLGTTPENGWHTIRSQYAEITVLQKQQRYTVVALETSASSGCKFCALLYKNLKIVYGETLEQEYCIFIRSNTSGRSEFKVASGNVNRYVEPFGNFSRPLSIALFQNMPPSNYTTSASTKMPLLSVLPHKHPSSLDAVHQIKTWMDVCSQHHKSSCVRSSTTLPKRVIDMGQSPDLSKLSLYLSKGEPKSYAVLSYSWGGNGKLFTTTNGTIQDRCAGFSLGDLPRTLRDGVRVAKALGFRYLWIDSLCIIQDDEKDWIHEGRAMTEIYGSSTLNISASSSTGSDEGFLEDLPGYGIEIGSFHRTAANNTGVIFADVPLKTLDLEEKAVSGRGWIFQERLVSVATIHYTNEGLIWECVSQTCLQHSQNFTGESWKSQWNDLIRKELHSVTTKDKFFDQVPSARNKFVIWHHWMNAYSSRNLFSWTDRFPAIAGVASTFAKKFSLTYRAGLWLENLASDLLWRRHNRNPTVTRFDTYVAPTWSWASVKGQIEYRQVELRSPVENLDLHILRCTTEEEYRDSFGVIVEGGYIEAKGTMQEITIDTATHPGVRKKSYQECGISEGLKNTTNVLCMLDEVHKIRDRFLRCWCLRVGTFQVYGREGVMFLLLERSNEREKEYRRIGLAETDPWCSGNLEVSDSGAFISGKWQYLVLI